ncbi:glycosyltransferase family 2 protein [uncultured Tateyamaria sp.]|uniref:glycosyltransferase family 2 protein n=1 Tax=uncultured Tateyamaria sp. TaxID=455651 RepID=UPI00262256B1|nr:glycosyltransferase family 2 protein [uncultured Tateyamaria sp.]
MPFVSRVIDKLRYVYAQQAKKARIKRASKLLSGPPSIVLGEADVAMVCLIRNGMYYLDTLLSHHRKIGVKKFLFIDNGSDDGTRERLAQEPGVTVISNLLPVATYECDMRAEIAREVISGGWFLFLDSDELLDLSHGEGRDITEYTAYCNAHDTTCVIAQRLDMYAPDPLAETESWSYEDSVRRFDQFSEYGITEFEYHDRENVDVWWFLSSNDVTNPAIKLKFGGIRGEIFGEDCGLTIHPLVKNLPGIDLRPHPHFASRVTCADFAVLVRHYKFAGPFLSRERQQVALGTWQHGEGEKRLNVIQDSDFSIRSVEDQQYSGTTDLVASGFLACSKRFLSQFPAPEPEARDKGQEHN